MSSEASPTRILLIIDVQRCLFDPPNPVPNSTRILHNLETVLARERAASPATKGRSHFNSVLLPRPFDVLGLSVAELLAANSKTTTWVTIADKRK